MTDCPRRNAWFRGCRFEPRYDEGPQAIPVTSDGFSSDEISQIIRAGKPRTYVRDVCITCGRTVEREAKV